LATESDPIRKIPGNESDWDLIDAMTSVDAPAGTDSELLATLLLEMAKSSNLRTQGQRVTI